MDAIRRLGSVSVRLSAAGGLAPDQAWERYECLDLWPSWSPQLRRAEARPRRLQAGLAGRVIGPAGVSAGFLVTAVDAGARRWSWTVRRWPITIELEHGIDADEAGSRTWLVLRGPAPAVLSYAPLAWYALHRLVTPPASEDAGTPTAHRLATYGTLAPGRANHDQLDGLAGRWLEGHVHGQLLAAGWAADLGFPALVLDRDRDAVDVHIFESGDLPGLGTRLDDFEGPGYRRVKTVVHTAGGPVEAYIYALADREGTGPDSDG